MGPTGSEVTRDYPMKEIEGEKHDHPHQRSWWFTHGNVNGIDFVTGGTSTTVRIDTAKHTISAGAGVIAG